MQPSKSLTKRGKKRKRSKKHGERGKSAFLLLKWKRTLNKVSGIPFAFLVWSYTFTANVNHAVTILHKNKTFCTFSFAMKNLRTTQELSIQSFSFSGDLIWTPREKGSSDQKRLRCGLAKWVGSKQQALLRIQILVCSSGNTLTRVTK